MLFDHQQSTRSKQVKKCKQVNLCMAMNRKQIFGGYAMEINALNQQISDLNISPVLMNEDQGRRKAIKMMIFKMSNGLINKMEDNLQY